MAKRTEQAAAADLLLPERRMRGVTPRMELPVAILEKVSACR